MNKEPDMKDKGIFNKDIDANDKVSNNMDSASKNKSITKKVYDDYEKIIRIMELYHTGHQKEAFNQMLEQLKYFIWHQMKIIYPTYFQNEEIRDDMYNEAVLEIIKSMDRYDAEKSVPTTFFAPYIIGGFRKAIDDMYDQRNSPEFKKIAKAIIKFEQQNKPLIETEIAAVANVSITDVKKYFEYKNAHDLVYISENPETDKDIKQKIQTPEEHFLENEKNNNIYSALQNLSEQEKKVIYTFFFTKPTGRFENKKRHTLESVAEMTGLDKDLVRTYLQRGLKRLKRDPKLKEYHFEKFTKFSDSVEFINHDVSVYDSIGDENDNYLNFTPVKAKEAQKSQEFILKPFDEEEYKSR